MIKSVRSIFLMVCWGLFLNQAFAQSPPTPQVINFPAISTKNLCTVDFNVKATSTNNTIPLTYSSLDQNVAAVDANGNVHIKSIGTTIITINQAGNALYKAAAPASQTLTVAILPPPAVFISPDKSLACAGSTITITANATATEIADVNYQWMLNGVNTGTNSKNLVLTDSKASDSYTCVVSSPMSCFPPATSGSLSDITIIPNSTPSLVITSSPDGTVCSGTTVNFTAVPTNVTTPVYQWLVNGVNAGSNSPVFQSSTFADNDQVTCSVTDAGPSCLTVNQATSNPIVVKITEPPIQQAIIALTGIATREGDVVNFSASVTDTIGVSKYQWQVNGQNAGTNSSTFSSKLLHNNDVVTCIITSNAACSVPFTSNQITLSLAPPLSITIPDTFTPNGDGINDLWDIAYLTDYPQCRVDIYNRYGSLIYHSVGYSKPWDGTVKGGDVPEGVYYYVISLNSTTKPLTGWLTVVR